MNYTNVKVPTITMDELTKLQNDYVFFEDIFNKVFDEKIQNLFKHILTNREQGAFVIGPESMDEKKYDTDFLVKLSTALTHLVGVPNHDAMYGKYYARFEVKNTDHQPK